MGRPRNGKSSSALKYHARRERGICGNCGARDPRHEGAALCEECYQGQVRGHLRRKFGLTPDAYEKLGELQGWVCGICGRDRRLVVDHCHKTGQVRALLCQPCNMLLGAAGDDPAILRLAARFLEARLSRG